MIDDYYGLRIQVVEVELFGSNNDKEQKSLETRRQTRSLTKAFSKVGAEKESPVQIVVQVSTRQLANCTVDDVRLERLVSE